MDEPPTEIKVEYKLSEEDRALLEAEARKHGLAFDEFLRQHAERVAWAFAERRESTVSEPPQFSEVFRFGCGTTQIPPRRTLGAEQAKKLCLFCGRGPDQGATFRNDAHVVPAAFGNRSLYSAQECDECNHRAGEQLENQLADAFAPIRALLGWRSRKGHVKHKPRGRSAMVSRALETAIVADEDDDSITVEPLPDGMRLSVAGLRYRPMAVARSLARMALFVLDPAQRREVAWLFDWLRGELAWNPTYAEFFWPGPRTPEFSLVVRATTQPDIPYLVEFGCGNLKYAMRLPTRPMPTTANSGVTLTAIDHGDEGNIHLVHVTSEDVTRDSSMILDLCGERRELPLNEPASELLALAGLKRQ